MKLNFTNLVGNLGNDLIRSIYRRAHELDATEVIVKSAKYGRYAIVDMYEGNDCIDLNMTIEA